MEGDAKSWQRRRPQQGRTRRRKRSGSIGANNQNKIKCTTQNDHSTFDVEIPNYYNGNSFPRISENIRVGDQKRLSAGVSNGDAAGDEKFPGENKSEHKRKVIPRMSEQAGTQAKGDEHDEIHLDKNKHVEVHDKFIAALETHGSSAGSWYAMASELEWTVEDVKVYAYSYFKALVQDRNVKNYDSLLIENGGQNKKIALPSTTDGTISSWSFHELILLDSLMVKYCKELSCLDVKQRSKEDSTRFIRQISVWEKIASQFPGKTALVCKERGISRLLKVYDERHLKTQSTY